MPVPWVVSGIVESSSSTHDLSSHLGPCRRCAPALAQLRELLRDLPRAVEGSPNRWAHRAAKKFIKATT